MKMICLSYPLDPGGPHPPAIPAPSLDEFLTVERDGASVQELRIFSHIGTHLDTSAHVFAGGAHITDFSPAELYFSAPAIVDLEIADGGLVTPSDLTPHIGRLKGCDCMLLRFGLADRRNNDPGSYALCSPGLSLEAGRFIADNLTSLKCLGIDAPSIASIPCLNETMGVHNLLLAMNDMRFLIIEEMRLDGDLGALFALGIHPWLVKGMHSGPCSVIGYINDKGTEKHD